jgi:hypothetical protein
MVHLGSLALAARVAGAMATSAAVLEPRPSGFDVTCNP